MKEGFLREIPSKLSFEERTGIHQGGWTSGKACSKEKGLYLQRQRESEVPGIASGFVWLVCGVEGVGSDGK